MYGTGRWTECESDWDPDARIKPWWTLRRERKFRGTKTWKTGTPGVEHGAGTSNPGSVSFPQCLDERQPGLKNQEWGSGWSYYFATFEDLLLVHRTGQETVHNPPKKALKITNLIHCRPQFDPC